MFNLELVSLVLSEEPAVVLAYDYGLIQVVDQIENAELVQEQDPFLRQFSEEILTCLQCLTMKVQD